MHLSCLANSETAKNLMAERPYLLTFARSHRHCIRRDGLGSASLPRRMEDVLKEEKNSNANVMYIHVCTYVV